MVLQFPIDPVTKAFETDFAHMRQALSPSFFPRGHSTLDVTMTAPVNIPFLALVF